MIASHCRWRRPVVCFPDQWPLQRGFDRFYGFLEGETDQFHPELVIDNHYVGPPADNEHYHVSEDLVDQARGVSHVPGGRQRLDQAAHGGGQVQVDQRVGEAAGQALAELELAAEGGQHAVGEGARGVTIAKDETRALMINEEDHLRIQVLASGLQLERLWQDINRIDDLIESGVEYAFDSRLGYLTDCPTNLGTGMRASVSGTPQWLL